MLKKEINFITDLNLNKLQILGDRFTISDLNKSDIHPALLKYISSSIDYEIFLDKKKIETNSIFNYNNDRIINYFNLISQEIKKTQNFEFDYIKKLLQNAILFNINYLSKPNSTLVKTIFNDTSIKSIEEIVLKLGNLYYYRYLQKILLTYLDKKQVILMRKEEFIELLNKIDSISKETHLDDTISTVINSMGNFFDPTSKSSPKIPLLAIQQYLDEKKMNEYSEKIFENFGDNQNLSISASDVLKVLKSVVPVSEISVDQGNDLMENFVEDTSTNEEVAEKLEPIETEILEIDETEDSEETEIFSVDSEDEEIPNSDLISSDHIISPGGDGENSGSDNKDGEGDKKNSAEQNSDNNHTDNENESDQIEDQKKKIDLNPVIDSLIDVNSLYNSLHTNTIPFDQTILKEKIIQFLTYENEDELNYKLDLSTICDELPNNNSPIIEGSIKNKEKEVEELKFSEFNTSNEDSDNEFLNKMADPSFELSELEILDENGEFEIDDKKDEFPVNFEDEDTEESNNEIIDENKLVLSEEENKELTEVFTDLIYLSEENKEELDKSDVLDGESIKVDEKSEKNENFEEIIISKDMTKIIENVFDYDMEDYHTLMNKISGTTSESDAFKLIEEYCIRNHIETHSNEVEKLRSIISEFFTQAYS